jgi:group I intron endonuclease
MSGKKYNCGIYRIRNIINNDDYIGQSIDLYSRKYSHFGRLRNKKHTNPHFQNAFDKYGEENFIFEIILYCEPEELTFYEQKCVNIFDPQYNIRKDCTDSNRGICPSEETKKKMSLAQIGKRRSDETKKRMSDSKMGEKNYNFGKPKTDSVKKKMSLSKMGENNPMYGKTMSEDTKKLISIFNKGKIVSEKTRKLLSKINTGRRHTEETKQKLSELKSGKNHPNFKSIDVVIEIKKMLDSNVPIRKISRELKVNRQTIYKVRDGYYKDAYGI